MKQNAKSDKPFTLKSHVLEREFLGKPGSGVKLTSKEGLSTGVLEQMTINGSRFDASQRFCHFFYKPISAISLDSSIFFKTE
ncbi:MAG: hypothetical protein WCB90_12320 [Methanosarcina sp.]